MDEVEHTAAVALVELFKRWNAVRGAIVGIGRRHGARILHVGLTRPHAFTAHAAEDVVAGFDAVADDTTAAVGARGCQALNRALEAVEGVAVAVHHDLKALLVIVSAGDTDGHVSLLSIPPQHSPP